MKKAYILGSRPGSGNIGDATAQRFRKAGWETFEDDGSNGDGARPRGGNVPDPQTAEQFGYSQGPEGHYQLFQAPSVLRFEKTDPDALIITLGKTYKGHFADIRDHEVANLIKASLILPLEAARRYVQAVGNIRKKDDTGWRCPRCGLVRTEQFTWAHKPLNSGIRTCGADPVQEDPQRKRHIVFVGSYAYTHPFTNGTLYCAAKAGLNMAARTLGWELTDYDFRVHIVHPYHVQGTPMWAEVERGVMESKGMSLEEADAYNRKDLKMPDLLTAEEVAQMILTLVTIRAMEWTSGTPIEMFGGSR